MLKTQKSINHAHPTAAHWRMDDWNVTFDGDEPWSEASHRDLHGRAAAAGVWTNLCLLVPACRNGLRHSHFACQEHLLCVSAFQHSCFVRIIAAELHAERAKRGDFAVCSHSGMNGACPQVVDYCKILAQCDGCLVNSITCQ
jgi:hypothetical protein